MSEEGHQSEGPLPPPPGDPASASTQEFRWQAFFQRSRQPLFLLNHQRRILFVNRAWEALTGVPAAQVRGLVCARRSQPALDRPEEVAQTLYPPAEAFDGKPSRARRLAPSRGGAHGCWDIDFFPLESEEGILGILGRIILPDEHASSGHAHRLDELMVLHEQAAKKRKATDKESLWQPETLLALGKRAAERYRLDQLGANLPALRQIADQVRLVSPSRVSVFIRGEPGTGKKWLARTIHHHGIAAELPFAVVDCGHLPAYALATILFGDGGAAGLRFGTLYLNDPASLPRDLQSRLCDLLALTEGAGARPRLIAGSCGDPVEEVQSGRLLEELRCALSTVELRLPPLRERRDDLPWLVERMLERATADTSRPITGLSVEAWDLVRSYPWPGNLRELYNALFRAAGAATGERIEAGNLPPYLRRAVRLEQTSGTEPARPLPLDRLLEEAERRLILLALERTGGRKARAADLLEIPRPRLFRRLKALGMLPGDDEEMKIEEADESEE